MKTGVKPPQNDHNGKRQWTSEQKSAVVTRCTVESGASNAVTSLQKGWPTRRNKLSRIKRGSICNTRGSVFATALICLRNGGCKSCNQIFQEVSDETAYSGVVNSWRSLLCRP